VATGRFNPTGGGAVTILIVSIFVRVACAMIAIETNRNRWGWMLAGVDLPFRGARAASPLWADAYPHRRLAVPLNLWGLGALVVCAGVGSGQR